MVTVCSGLLCVQSPPAVGWTGRVTRMTVPTPPDAEPTVKGAVENSVSWTTS